MKKKSIKNLSEYDIALERIYKLMQQQKTNAKESIELEDLSFLVENYDKKHFKLPKKSTKIKN